MRYHHDGRKITRDKKTGKQIKLNRMKMWEIAKSKLVVSYMQTQPFHFSFHPPPFVIVHTRGTHMRA